MKKLDNIFSPKFVMTPPTNAFNSLEEIDKGIIRCYSLADSLYIESKDYGIYWDTVHNKKELNFGRKNPLTGTKIRLFSGPKIGEVSVARCEKNKSKWTENIISHNGAIMLKPALFINGGKRVIVPFHTTNQKGAATFYSDDDGITWKHSNFVNSPKHTAGGIHKGTRWNHGAVEPTIVELNDGRLWMLMRTAQDYLYQSFSNDGGKTWSTSKPTNFHSTITMPTIGRLKDGKLLLIWNNTTPLPELKQASGKWEDVFTNRDALHVALSDDDGHTWYGFRELALNESRNSSSFATQGGKGGSLDRSVQQSEFIEVSPGKILVSLGQHPTMRKIILFDEEWISQKNRSWNSTEGLAHWSTQKYIKGIVGHCSYNRKDGACMIQAPKDSINKVLCIRAQKDSTLINYHDGALWNFPTHKSGELEMKFYITALFKGVEINLLDRWINPIDTLSSRYSPISVPINSRGKIHKSSLFIEKEKWHTMKIIWKDIDKKGTFICKIDNQIALKQSIDSIFINGINYLHILSTAPQFDDHGLLVKSVAVH